MKLITWNLNGRRNRTQQQVEALAAQGTDLVALQEVTAHSLPELRTALVARGLVHILDGFAPVPLTDRPRKYRQLVASRFPVRLHSAAIPVPWPEAVLATIVESPRGEIELYNCHIPPRLSVRLEEGRDVGRPLQTSRKAGGSVAHRVER